VFVVNSDCSQTSPYLPLRLKKRAILDSSVGIATGYGLDGRQLGVRVLVGSRMFSTSSRSALGFIQPPI
jgi:hypothetical protein